MYALVSVSPCDAQKSPPVTPLRGIACGEESLGRWSGLRPTIDAFHSARLPDRYTDVWCGYADPFSRAVAA